MKYILERENDSVRAAIAFLSHAEVIQNANYTTE